MHVLNQIIGALVEAWGEVKVQKARVILSLVGVVAAVAAMSTVIALGSLISQSLDEMQEASQGRSITLHLNLSKKVDEGSGAGSTDGRGGFAVEGGPMISYNTFAEEPKDEQPAGRGEDVTGKPLDPFGDAMTTVADRFKIPYWSRVEQGGVSIREFTEANNTGFYRDKPIIQPLWGFTDPSIKAVDPDYQVLFRLTTIQGRWLQASDVDQRVAPVVINSTMWDQFGQPDLHDPMVISTNDETDRMFRVVGVIKAKSSWEGPEMYTLYDSWRYMNVGKATADPNVTMMVWVGEDQAKEARRILPSALASVMGPGWEANVNGGEGFDMGQGSLQMVNNVIMGIGAIVIFLGALGLLNVAIVTVRQRIREIGIRRAMGASAKRVFFAVFMESVVATFVAGVIGVGIAVVVLRLLPLEAMDIYLQDRPPFPFGAALAGVGISTSIGALCGIIPALAAVRVKPIDAIRY